MAKWEEDHLIVLVIITYFSFHEVYREGSACSLRHCEKEPSESFPEAMKTRYL